MFDGEQIPGAAGKHHRASDANHHGAREEAAARRIRVVVLIELREQWRHRPAEGDGQQAAHDEQRLAWEERRQADRHGGSEDEP